MESLYFLVPCALIFVALAVKVLFWAINNGQYDNLDTEAHRILFDEGKNKAPPKASSEVGSAQVDTIQETVQANTFQVNSSQANSSQANSSQVNSPSRSEQDK